MIALPSGGSQLLISVHILFALLRARFSLPLRAARAVAICAAVVAACAGQAQAQPAINSATYDASTGVLTVSATGIVGTLVNLGKFTLTGEGGATYTLTASNVVVDSATAFHATLAATDRAALATILNKAGTSSTGGTPYNVAAADDWDVSVTTGDTSDPVNPLTVTNVPVPTINSGDATLLPQLAPFANDLDAQKLFVNYFGRPAGPAELSLWAAALANTSTTFVSSNFAGSQEYTALIAPYTTSAQLVDYTFRKLFGRAPDAPALAFWVSQVDSSLTTRQLLPNYVASSAQGNDLIALNNKYAAAMLFTRSLDTAAEQSGYSGAASNAVGRSYIASVTDNASYATATASAALLDTLNAACGFGPRSTYDGSSGVLTINGKNLLSLAGPGNDIKVSKLTISGDGTPYTLTSADVDIVSDTRFSITLNATDRAALLSRLNQNGDTSVGSVAYNIAAADHWAMGADAAVNVADLTGNGIVVSNFIATLPQCMPGNWSVTGTVPCDPASPGYYVSGTGATAQTPAGPGYYVPGPGATMQTPCALGTTSTAPAATSCVGLPILNIDNSDPGTRYDAATDGILLMRYLLGLRGAALIVNARGFGAALRDAAQIEAHINTYITLFDVDGDGQTLAMTDGLMILRRLLNPAAPTTDAAAMAAITAGAKNNPARTDATVVAAIDALRP